jgi:hypothetical protein
VAPALTLAQATEVAALALMPMILLRLGLRGTLLAGLASWVLSLSLLACGQPLGLVVGSLAFNGLGYSGFLVVGQMFVNRAAGDGLRASAQSLLTFVNGLGQFLGHLLVGQLRQWTGDDLPRVFLFGSVLTTALLVLFLAAFRDRPAPAAA